MPSWRSCVWQNLFIFNALSVCVSVCLSVCLIVCLFVCLFMCLYVCLSFRSCLRHSNFSFEGFLSSSNCIHIKSEPKCTEIRSEKVRDLSHIELIWWNLWSILSSIRQNTVPITRLAEYDTQHDMMGSILSTSVSTHRFIWTPLNLFYYI